MKIVRVLVLTLLVAAFMSARARPAAAADTAKAMLIGGLIGAGVGVVVVLVMRMARSDSAQASLGAPPQPARRSTAFELGAGRGREVPPATNDRAAWTSGTILRF